MSIKPATKQALQTAVKTGDIQPEQAVVMEEFIQKVATTPKAKKVVAPKPGLAAHQSVLSSLEHRLGKSGDDEVDAVLVGLIKHLKYRMRPWAKVTVQYTEE